MLVSLQADSGGDVGAMQPRLYIGGLDFMS